jgi:hypothetical protein
MLFDVEGCVPDADCTKDEDAFEYDVHDVMVIVDVAGCLDALV